MKQKTLVMALLMTLGGAAHAQSPYAGAGLGYSMFDVDTDPFTTSSDDTGTAWKLFGGMMFTPNLGVEVGYASHGKASLSETIPGNTVDYVDDYRWRSSSLYAAGVGAMPINHMISVYGKLGLHLWDLEMKYHQRDYEAGIFYPVGSGTVSEDGISPMLAVGAEFALMPQVGLRVEYERYFDIGKSSTTGESDVDILGVSASYRF